MRLNLSEQWIKSELEHLFQVDDFCLETPKAAAGAAGAGAAGNGDRFVLQKPAEKKVRFAENGQPKRIPRMDIQPDFTPIVFNPANQVRRLKYYYVIEYCFQLYLNIVCPKFDTKKSKIHKIYKKVENPCPSTPH
jgi:hypothetical protein